MNLFNYKRDTNFNYSYGFSQERTEMLSKWLKKEIARITEYLKSLENNKGIITEYRFSVLFKSLEKYSHIVEEINRRRGKRMNELMIKKQEEQDDRLKKMEIMLNTLPIKKKIILLELINNYFTNLNKYIYNGNVE